MILLINPPSPFLIDQRVHPPMGLIHLGTYLRDHDVEVAIHDPGTCTLEGMEDISPELVGITATTPQYPYAVEMCSMVRDAYPGVPIVVGGPHATVDPTSCTQFDYVVIGEGERAILDCRNWNDRIIRYDPIEELDALPHPDRTMIDIESYQYYLDGERSATFATSRGCPYKCAFCCHIWGSMVRLHSPEYIAEEVRSIKRVHGYRAVTFQDDIFILHRDRITRVAELLSKEDIIYRCFVRSNLTDDNILRMLKKSGCVEIGFGAESGSQKILDNISKGTTVEMNTILVESARRFGIRTKAFLIVGLPGETHKTCQETYDWIRNVQPDSWDISIYIPYSGSSIVDNPEMFDIQICSINYADMWHKGIPGAYNGVVSTHGLSVGEIITWRDRIELELGYRRHEHPADNYTEVDHEV